jgi:hypothetical protein
LIHHSPMFRLTPMPGSFRSAPYEAPSSTALRSASSTTARVVEVEGAPAAPSSTMDATSALVSRLHQAGTASRPMRILPPRVTFPHLGPSIFLVSELTGENQSPVVEVDFQRDRKRGER